MPETGHAPNVANFATMISFVTGYGAPYNPSNPLLDLAALQAKLTSAQASIDGVSTTLAGSKVAINNRQNAFDGIRRLVTRVVNAFEVSGAPANAVEDAKGFKRKIDGKRAEALEDDPNTPEDESLGISVSQQSYTQLVEHFDNLIELLEAHPVYDPNESDLKVVTLTNLSTTLKAANTSVINSATTLSNARLTRNEDLYAETDGLVEIADLVKKYVKSVFGADSPQFLQITGLKFTTP